MTIASFPKPFFQLEICDSFQGRNHGKMLAATSAMVGRICPPPLVGIGLKVSENLGVTSVAPVAPVVTSLHLWINFVVMLKIYMDLMEEAPMKFCFDRNTKSFENNYFLCSPSVGFLQNSHWRVTRYVFQHVNY